MLQRAHKPTSSQELAKHESNVSLLRQEIKYERIHYEILKRNNYFFNIRILAL